MPSKVSEAYTPKRGVFRGVPFCSTRCYSQTYRVFRRALFHDGVSFDTWIQTLKKEAAEGVCTLCGRALPKPPMPEPASPLPTYWDILNSEDFDRIGGS